MSLFSSDFPIYDENPSHETETLGPGCEGLLELINVCWLSPATCMSCGGQRSLITLLPSATSYCVSLALKVFKTKHRAHNDTHDRLTGTTKTHVQLYYSM